MTEKKTSLRIWDVIKIFLLFILLQLTVTLVTVILAIFISFNTSHPLTNSLNFIIALIIVIKITSRKYEISLNENLIMITDQRKMILPIIIFSLGLSIFISEVGNYVRVLFPMSDFMKEIFSEVLGGEVSYIGTIILVLIVAPITEEILLRGIMLKGLLKRYSPLKSIVITSLLFGILHFNIYQFVAAFISGTLLGWLFTKTKSLVLCIIGHASYNSIGFILGDLLKLEIKGYTLDGFQPIWFTLFGIVILIIVGMILRKQANNSQFIDIQYGDTNG